MPPDTVQIGSWIISKSAFDAFVPFVAALLGTLVGGLTTYLATNATEKRKWEREIAHERRQERREAFAIALDWIEPLDQALTKASLLVSSFQFRGLDEEGFVTDYPDLISSLARLDPPSRLRVHLGKEAYAMSFDVIDGVEELKAIALQGLESFEECVALVTNLKQKVGKLQEYLETEYLVLFGINIPTVRRPGPCPCMST